MGLQMETAFPFSPEVSLRVLTRSPLHSRVRIRVPSWASTNMDIFIDDKKAATGKPGAFVVLDRRWDGRERIRFTLPMSFRLTQYEGMEPFTAWTLTRWSTGRFSWL